MPIDSHLSYLQKHAFCKPQIATPPAPQLGMVVVIPCHDEPDPWRTLESLLACRPNNCAVEVIVVVASSERDAPAVVQRNIQTHAQISAWAQASAHVQVQFHAILCAGLPAKHAGVGLARKIGMDEAVHRLALVDAAAQGIIVSLDADATVDAAYFEALTYYFERNRGLQSCSMDFAYAVEEQDALHQAAILRIELAERILVAGLRHAGHPYAFHTLGAAFAVRASAYEAQAGMNKRKAGEDFDFLQKFIELGVHGECRATKISLSARSSQRKPAGIGQLVAQYCAAPDTAFPVFARDGFLELRAFFQAVPDYYRLDRNGLMAALEAISPALQGYLEAQGFLKTILEIQQYTRSAAAFEKRFFRWFNSLKTFHCFQYFQQNFYENQPLLKEANAIRNWILGNAASDEGLELEALLVWFRAAAEAR